MVDACWMFLYFCFKCERHTARHCIDINCVYVLCIALHIGWMLMHVGCFLNFVSNRNDAMIVSIFYAFYCTLDELFAWMLICVTIVTCSLYVSDLFQHWLEHLFDDWHILYLWSVNLFLTCDWIYLNTINKIQYNTKELEPLAGIFFKEMEILPLKSQ
jgi:hypothetical protein